MSAAAPAATTGEAPSRPAVVGRSAVALVLVGAALPAVGHAYGSGWLVPVAVAAIASVAIGGIARLLRAGLEPGSAEARGAAVATVAVQVLVAGLWTAVAVRPAVDGTTALGGLADGIARLLSTIAPVDPRGPELAVAVLATWLVGALTTAALARPRPTSLALVPPLSLYGAGLVLGDPSAVLGDGSPLALALAGGLTLALVDRSRTATGLRAQGGERGPRVLRPIRAVAVVAVAAGVGVVVTPVVPGLDGRDRVDVRARIEPPIEVVLAENPIDLVPLRREEAAVDVRFRARVSLPAGTDGRLYWRLSVLEEVGVDGWRQRTDGYTRVGSTLGPPPEGPGAARAEADLDVTLGPSTGGLPLVPTVDRPLTVEPGGLAFEPRTAQLAVPRGRGRPARLRMRASIPAYTSADLLGATAAEVTAPTGLPPAAVALARTSVARTPNDFQRLTSLVDVVAERPALRLDVAHRGDTADRTVAELLVPEPPAAGEAGPTDGPSEEPTDGADEPGGDGPGEEPEIRAANDGQLAAAFALLARAEGFDVRLVVGYLTPVPGDRTEDRDAEVEATDDRLTVWPEVRFTDLGWVPFRIEAPTGTAGESGGTPPPSVDGTSVVDDEVASQREQLPAPSDDEPARPDRAAPAASGRAGGGPGRAWLVVAGVSALALVLGLGPLARWGRRRRRSSGDPRRQLRGAWDEAVDRLAEGGLGVGADHTRPDVASRAAAELGEPATALWWLAQRTDRLDFAGASGFDLGDEDEPAADVRRAWHVVDGLTPAVRARRTRRQRFVAAVRPPRRLRPGAWAGDLGG